MITLKHLAREANMDPYKLRQKLREKFGIRRRWRWDPSVKKELKDLNAIREFLSLPPHQDIR